MRNTSANRSQLLRARLPLILGGLTALLLALPATGQAQQITFGSDLSQASTLYFPSPYDIAFWELSTSNGSSSKAPADGQILQVRMKGCAEYSQTNPAGSPNSAAPFTETHFQDLVPQAGGALKANVTTNRWDTPVCGQNGADQNTVTTFSPINFCVKQGDYVDWNDAGGFDGQPHNYPKGVYYDFFVPASGPSTDFYRAPNGTNNGDLFTPAVAALDRNGNTANQDDPYPWDTNYSGNGAQNIQLNMQIIEGTGPDATPLCPGGTQGQAPASPGAKPTPGAPVAPTGPPATVSGQPRLGVNRKGVTLVSVYCHLSVACSGYLAIDRQGAAAAKHLVLIPFSGIPAHRTGKVKVRLGKSVVSLINRHHRRLTFGLILTDATASPAKTFTGKITLYTGR